MSNEQPKYVIGEPHFSQIPELRALWKEAFGDTDDFLDTFESTAFSLKRCRCVTIGKEVAAALYWFDCLFADEPVAYIYAVATAQKYRGQGLCHDLMSSTHDHLKSADYRGALLSPATPALFDFYKKIGYVTCAYHDEISVSPDTLYAYEQKNISIHRISKKEFAQLRKKFLPQDALIQENENLDFLETQAVFYTGENFLLTARKEGEVLLGIELLGDTSVIPFILTALECSSGKFRTPGKDKPSGMYYSFTDSSPVPGYLGFAFD